MAAELRQALPDRVGDVDLIKSGGGVFEIRRGNELIFSKKQLGRFPEPSEIIQKLKN